MPHLRFVALLRQLRRLVVEGGGRVLQLLVLLLREAELRAEGVAGVGRLPGRLPARLRVLLHDLHVRLHLYHLGVELDGRELARALLGGLGGALAAAAAGRHLAVLLLVVRQRLLHERHLVQAIVICCSS